MKRLNKLRYFMVAIALMATLGLSAQDVQVTVDCPNVVRRGEPFEMVVAVTGKSSRPVFPEMTAFKVVGDRGSGQSISTSNVNGKVQTTVSYTFAYAVEALTEGTQSIPPISVTVNGKKYSSQAVTVQVVGATGSTQQAQQGAAAGSSNAGAQTNDRDVYLSVIPSRTRLYQGESLTATIKVFSRKNLSNISDFKLPTFDGFFKQEIPTPQLTSLTQETINGVTYGTGVLQQYSLSPQKSGTITIGPSSMQVLVQQRVQRRSRSMFDDFFGGSIQQIPMDLKSAPVNITVLPLPTEGQPASFTNGVGQLKMNTSIDKTEVKANDPITVKVVVSGSGNLRFVDAPKVNFPPDFEIWDPTVNTSLNATSTAGSKTFEYVIVPRHGGNYQLPPIEFSYFDPQAKQYKTVRSEAYNLTVEKGDEQSGGSSVISGITREDVKFIGKDISYLKPVTGLSMVGKHFFGTWLFWLWYVLPALAFTAIVYLRRKFIRRFSDVAMVKSRRASRYASKRLKRARSFMNANQSAQFYEELSRALWGFLSDKLNIPISDLSRDNCKQMLLQHSVDETKADDFIAVIDDCEFARYAPAAVSGDMKTLYGRAEDAINGIN